MCRATYWRSNDGELGVPGVPKLAPIKQITRPMAPVRFQTSLLINPNVSAMDSQHPRSLVTAIFPEPEVGGKGLS